MTEIDALAAEQASVHEETALARREKSKLRVLIGRMDGLVLMLCALVGLDTVGAVSSYGAQSITWLLFMALFFFVPYALLCSELGTAFPEEGGPYIWVKLAFGRLTAGITSLLYWITNPIWLGGTLTITAVAAFGDFFTPLHGAWKFLFALAFIWIVIGATIFSFNVGKIVLFVGAWARAILLTFFTISALVYAAKHGVHGFGAGSFSPSQAIFLAAVPVLFFSFEGFELPSEAGEEMINPNRDVPVNILRGAFGTVLMYGLPILAILLILPPSQQTSLGGFLDSVKLIFTVFGGHVTSTGSTLTGLGKLFGDLAAAGFIIALLSSATSWIMGGNRGLAVAGLDGAAPRSFGTISEKYGTPISVDLIAGVVATITMIAAFWLSNGNAAKYFSVVLGVTISTSAVSYLAIFPALIKLRYSHSHIPRPFRIPGGMPVVWGVGILTTLWAGVATLALLYPGIGTSNPNGSLPSGWSGERGLFEVTQALPLAVIITVGVIWYVLAAPTRRELADVR